MKFSVLFFLLLCTDVWARWSVATYNIRNFDREPGGATNLRELENIIREMKSDVMAFEEVVNAAAFKELIKRSLPGYAVRISSCGGFGRQNLAVVYNPRSFRFVSEYEDRSFSGSQNDGCGSLRPVFFVTLAHSATKEEYTFGVVHLKAGGSSRAMSRRWEQYQKLTEVALEYQDKNLILLGDFNTTGYNIQDEDFNKFENFMQRSTLKTTSEKIECSNYWHGGDGEEFYEPSLLDHIVIQEKFSRSVEEIKVGAHCAQQECRSSRPEELGSSFESVSDHCPVQVTFR